MSITENTRTSVFAGLSQAQKERIADYVRGGNEFQKAAVELASEIVFRLSARDSSPEAIATLKFWYTTFAEAAELTNQSGTTRATVDIETSAKVNYWNRVFPSSLRSFQG